MAIKSCGIDITAQSGTTFDLDATFMSISRWWLTLNTATILTLGVVDTSRLGATVKSLAS